MKIIKTESYFETEPNASFRTLQSNFNMSFQDITECLSSVNEFLSDPYKFKDKDLAISGVYGSIQRLKELVDLRPYQQRACDAVIQLLEEVGERKF